METSAYAIPGVKSLGKYIKSSIVNEVCYHYSVDREEIFSKRRFRRIVEPRMLAMVLIRYGLNMTLVEVGKYFNQTNANILYAEEQVHNLYSTNKSFRESFTKIVERLFEDEESRKNIIERLLSRG